MSNLLLARVTPVIVPLAVLCIGCKQRQHVDLGVIREKETKPEQALVIKTSIVEEEKLKEMILSLSGHCKLSGRVKLEFFPLILQNPEDFELKAVNPPLAYFPIQDTSFEKKVVESRGFSLRALKSERVASLYDMKTTHFELDTAQLGKLRLYLRGHAYNFTRPCLYQVYYFELVNGDSVVFTRREIQLPFTVFKKYVP
ncbi:MAG: hypothetical protein ACP5JH_05075 [Bacteroidota bacterium]